MISFLRCHDLQRFFYPFKGRDDSIVFLGSFTGFTYTSYALMAQEKQVRLSCLLLVD